MQLAPGVEIDEEALALFRRAHGIRRLALFGSALGSRFREESDVDLLVEFEPGQVPGLIRLAAMELELEDLVGRNVEVRTLSDLSPYFRSEVASDARTLYAAA
jgi:uncharacterized protein